MLRTIAVATLVALTPAVAQAQTAENFNGFFAGVQGGWGERDAEVAFDVAGVTDFDDSSSSFDFGAFAGYDARVGENFVIGAELGIGTGGKTLRGDVGLGFEASVDPKWNYDVTARAGFVAGDALLFYGRIGYGGERTQIRLTDTSDDSVDFSESGWSDGLILGGGVEYAFTPNVSGRVEYRNRDMEGDYSAQQVLAGVAYRF